MKKIDCLNRRLEKSVNEILSTYRLGEEELNGLKFNYDMLFGWWMLDNNGEYDDEKIQQMCNAEYVDFFDLISVTMTELSKILKGKREFDFDNISQYKDKEMRKYYYDVDGAAIQKHNKMLSEYSLDLIDYMYACITKYDGYAVFEKYVEK